MRKKVIAATLAVLLGAGGGGAFSQSRDQIQVAGSSTVLPYAKIVAEIFGETYPQFKTPVIESGGSGAGIKEFCRGVGSNTIDIANASRPMKSSELQSCLDAGVSHVMEVRFGYDGVVFASDISGPDWHFEPQDIYQALAAQIVVEGKLVANKTRQWSEIDAKFPDFDISAYIPGEKHGTREVFEEKLMLVGCKASGAYTALIEAGLDDKAANSACIAVRKDGRAVDIDGDYSETLARIEADKTGLGVFGLSFYENNADRLKIASVDGIVPTVESIASGQYPLSRPLYFYVKGAHLDQVAGLRDYVAFFLSDQMIGSDGPLADYGLIAAPDEEREAARADFAGGKIMTLP